MKTYASSFFQALFVMSFFIFCENAAAKIDYAHHYHHIKPRDQIDAYIKLYDKAQEQNPHDFRKKPVEGLFDIVQEKAFPLIKQSMNVPKEVYEKLQKIGDMLEQELNNQEIDHLAQETEKIFELLPVATVSFAQLHNMYKKAFGIAKNKNYLSVNIEHNLEQIKKEITEIQIFIDNCNKKLDQLWYSTTPLDFKNDFPFIFAELQEIMPNGIMALKNKGLTPRQFQQINAALASLLDIYKNDKTDPMADINWRYFIYPWVDDAFFIIYLHPNKELSRHLSISTFNDAFCHDNYPAFLGSFDIHVNKNLHRLLTNKETEKNTSHWYKYIDTSHTLDHDFEHVSVQILHLIGHFRPRQSNHDYQNFVKQLCAIRKLSSEKGKKRNILENGIFLITHEIIDNDFITHMPKSIMDLNTFIEYVKNEYFQKIVKRYDFANVTKKILTHYKDAILDHQKEDKIIPVAELKLQAWIETIAHWKNIDKKTFDSFKEKNYIYRVEFFYSYNNFYALKKEITNVLYEDYLPEERADDESIKSHEIDRYVELVLIDQEDQDEYNCMLKSIRKTYKEKSQELENIKINESSNNDKNLDKVIDRINASLYWIDNFDKTSNLRLENTFLYNLLSIRDLNNDDKTAEKKISSFIHKEIEICGYTIKLIENPDKEPVAITTYKKLYRDLEQLFKTAKSSRHFEKKKGENTKTLAYYIEYYRVLNKELKHVQEQFWSQFLQNYVSQYRG